MYNTETLSHGFNIIIYYSALFLEERERKTSTFAISRTYTALNVTSQNKNRKLFHSVIIPGVTKWTNRLATANFERRPAV